MGAVQGLKNLPYVTALALASAAALAAILSGVGNRVGAMDFRTGFVVLRFAVYAGLAALVLALAALWLSRPWSGLQRPLFAALAFVVGALVVAFPLNQIRIAKSVPPINDITTDLTDPPAFVAILPLRAGAPVPADYGGPRIAE